ncbi:MAG: twin-arginine translocation signal domain-containing protein, partial [bacterium]
MHDAPLTRRNFLRASCAAILGSAALPAAMHAAIESTEPLKITRFEAVTFRKDIKIGGGSGGSDGAEFC